MRTYTRGVTDAGERRNGARSELPVREQIDLWRPRLGFIIFLGAARSSERREIMKKKNEKNRFTATLIRTTPDGDDDVVLTSAARVRYVIRAYITSTSPAAKNGINRRY